jgi:hypothetical protein
MPAAAKHAEEIFSLAAGVAAALAPRQGATADSSAINATFVPKTEPLLEFRSKPTLGKQGAVWLGLSGKFRPNVKANAFPALEKTDDLEEIVSPRVAGRPQH